MGQSSRGFTADRASVLIAIFQQRIARSSALAARALLLTSAILGIARPASGQLRDSFEAPGPTWTLREADCGVRVLLHERTYRDAKSGQASEHVRLSLGNGTYAFLVQPIGKVPIIPELAPSLFVKCDRPNVQLLARVVFPRNIDRGTGQPITSWLRGDSYTDVGQWQQLLIRDVGTLLTREVIAQRAQGREIDDREAHIDLIVVNAYTAPGATELWLDDLEIQGYVNLDETTGPQISRRPAGADERAGVGREASYGASRPGAQGPPSAAAVQGSLLIVRGRPLMVRAIQHQGEPLEWLKSLGFNALKVSASPSAAELTEARRLGLWLIAPPPYADQAASPETYDPVIAWSLGTRLVDRDLKATQDLAQEVRAFDPHHDRPLLCGADSSLSEYSRLANLLLLERTVLGTTQELADLRPWLLSRPRLARAGTPVLTAVETQRPARLGEQLVLFGRGAEWEEDIDPQQLRLSAWHALAAGARGLIFPSDSPLAIDTGSSALRTDSLRLLNMELQLLEPWIAAGQLNEELAGDNGGVQVSVLQTERSRLLLITQHAQAQQFVLGPPPRDSLSVLVPGVGLSERAYLVSLAGVKPLKVSHGGGGARIMLDEAPHAAAVVVTQDPLAVHHLNRTLASFRQEAARLRYDVTARRLVRVVEIDRQLTEAGHPLTQSAAWLREAQAHLLQAQRLFESSDFENTHASTTKAERLLAQVRRGHWEQTAAAFPSPAASPCIAQFTTLPLHWTAAERIRSGQWGPNVQVAGDMESLDQMLKAGWRQQRQTPAGVASDVSLSLQDPRAGRSALRLQAWAADVRQAPQALDRPLVWITSSPIPVRQGQLVRIHGWANVPRQLAASGEGLLVFDSIGGSELGDRIRLTQGWREFTLYRAVPQTGDLTITFALTGLGEASLDDLSVGLLEPEPIRPAE